MCCQKLHKFLFDHRCDSRRFSLLTSIMKGSTKIKLGIGPNGRRKKGIVLHRKRIQLLTAVTRLTKQIAISHQPFHKNTKIIFQNRPMAPEERNGSRCLFRNQPKNAKFRSCPNSLSLKGGIRNSENVQMDGIAARRWVEYDETLEDIGESEDEERLVLTSRELDGG